MAGYSSATFRPRGATHDTSGSAAVYAAAGETVRDKFVIPDEKLLITVADGGVSKSGTFRVVWG